MGLLDFVKRQLPAIRLPATITPAAPSRQTVQPVITTVDEFPAHTREKALEKQRFVALVQTMVSGGSTLAIACDKVAALHGQEFPLLAQGGKNNASQLTLNNYRNWVRVAKGIRDPEMQLIALADKYARGFRAPKGDPRFWKELHAAWLNGRGIPITQAYRCACEIIRKIDPCAKVPTLAQAAYQLRRIPAAVTVLAEKGSEGFKNGVADYIDRSWDDIPAGYCIVGDSRTFDTRVKTWDEKNNRWVAKRPIVAGLMDAKSWSLVSYWITTEPVCADTIIDCLRLYVAKAGNQPPAVAYFDNGADYCAQGFAKDLIVEGKPHSIFRELGIRLINALPKNAKAKTIERMFRDTMQQFDKLFPDYLGSKPEQRTMDAAWFDKHPEELPSLEQFCQVFEMFLERYHTTPKSGHILKNQSPEDVWNNRPARPAMTPERLKMAFLRPIGTRIVGRGPAVQIDNARYICDDLEWNSKVLVKTDTLDPEHVYCFSLEGALLGEARTRDRINALALDDESARKAIGDQMARARRQLKDAKTTLHDLTGGKHLLSILELMSPENERLLASSARKDPIHKVKGQEYAFARKTLAEAFPEAADVNPPPPRPALVDTPKVDRELLDMVHKSRHQQHEPVDEGVRLPPRFAAPIDRDEEDAHTTDYRALVVSSGSAE